MHPPEGPPVCTAFTSPPPGTPPPISCTISRNGVPMGTSIRPVLVIFPARANTFVPLLFSVPMLAYHSAPLRMMVGIFANVSTLLMSVGNPQSPLSAGKGGRGRGTPRLPSIEEMSAVSSPQTNAPAPMRISMRKSKGDSKMFVPNSPMRRACRMAVLRRLMARGYSPRT